MAFHDETRRCGACREPALICEYAVDQYRGRQQVGTRGHWRCQRCGATVVLLSAGMVLVLGGTGLLTFGALGAVLLWAATASASGNVVWPGAICGGLLILLSLPTVAVAAALLRRLLQNPVVTPAQ